MPGRQDEGARGRTHVFVLVAGQEHDPSAALVVAFAQVRRAAVGELELVGPLLEVFVHVSEGRLVFGRSLGGAHEASLPGSRLSETTAAARIAGVNKEQRQRARNEALFREVNERIVELETGLGGYEQDDSLLIGFVCECPREDCSELVEVTRRQYESVRENPRRFVVLPGHEDGNIADVVERHEHYLVVEKEGEAGEIAVEQDPRT